MELPLNDTALWKHGPPPNLPSSLAGDMEGGLPATQTVDARVDLSAKFNRIFFETKDRLYHFVRKLTQHETDAKDIIQNCYASLWQKITAVDDSSDVLPLLFTYARNAVIDHLRKKTRQRQLITQLQQQDTTPPDAISPPEQLIHYKERLQQLQSTIDQLPAKRKEIFTLVKQEGLSHKIVADQLGISPATVEKQVGLSLKFLRKEMNIN
ncbi:RNA polymerase sigma-70 factor [Longitalea luteola]|uniref:RNA polymerase sigma-70 factor n=1 Tax=Longitalea luteola TaxID=2812563 RepID=UPI001A95EECC|nr:RNA polymerase sigma-70 factor [Longitalea luteola]